MKKSKKQKKAIDESWLLTYSDSITLLMAFFVLLLSVSTIDQSKVELLTSGMEQVFTKTESDMPFSSMKKKLNEIIKEKELEEKISITPDPLGIKLRFSSRALFETGSAVIKLDMIPMIYHVANAVLTSQYKDYTIKVEGHTDDVPIKTPFYQSNWELSAHRATNVVKKLIAAGIPKKNVRAIAMADAYPLAPNMRPDGSPNSTNRAKNRRIEVFIHRNFK